MEGRRDGGKEGGREIDVRETNLLTLPPSLPFLPPALLRRDQAGRRRTAAPRLHHVETGRV